MSASPDPDVPSGAEPEVGTVVKETETERIMLVEDDQELAQLIADRLRAEGYEVRHEADGKAACEAILSDPPDLVILDIMLPGLDGFGVCREIRPAYQGPVLILTARDDDLDQILGLELGADDFVIKPVRPRVLLARIRALMRRSRPSSATGESRRLTLGALVVDASRREAILASKPIVLTTVEFDLLWYLASHAGQTVSRDELYSALYNSEYDGVDRAVDMYVSRIRQKLGDDQASPRYLKTVRGVGYLFVGEQP